MRKPMASGTEFHSSNQVFDRQLFCELYPKYPSRQIAEMTGWDYRKIKNLGKNMGLKKQPKAKTVSAGKIEFTDEMNAFLKDSYERLTNRQLAEQLGLKLTVVRNQLRLLSLRRIEMEYWTNEQIAFLKANYKTLGNAEIVDHFQANWPKKKPWKNNHIIKKMRYLKLARTKEEVSDIARKYSSESGRRFTILKNSSSLNMHDTWVANQLAWRNKDLREEMLKHPEIIQAKRLTIKAKRKLKQLKNGKK